MDDCWSDKKGRAENGELQADPERFPGKLNIQTNNVAVQSACLAAQPSSVVKIAFRHWHSWYLRQS